MVAYITIEQVDALLGVGWTTEDKKPRAVMMANVWLTAIGLPKFDPIPDDVVMAGAEIAREAAAGNIYTATQTGVTAKSSKAGSVGVSKSFAEGSRMISAGEQLALAMLAKYLSQNGQSKIVRS